MKQDMWLLEAQPFDPVAEDQVNVRLSKGTTIFFNGNDATAPNRTYRGWLSQALTCTRGLGGLAGLLGLPAQSGVGAAVLTVGDEFAATRALFKRYIWAGYPVQIYKGVVGEARATYEKRYDGLFNAQPDFSKMRVALPVADLLEKLDQPFQPAQYLGTGGFEGGADLKGQYKLDAVGDVFFVEGIWVDQNNGWADYCASGFDTVYRVTDGASELVEDPSNPPAVGKYYVDDANGRIRYGSLPTYGYRVDFRSAFAGASRALGTITKEIATARAGYVSGQIDSASFTALDTDRPEKVGWAVSDGMTMRDLYDLLLGRMLCFYTTTPDKISVGLLTASAATVETDSSIARVFTDRDIVPGTLQRPSFAAPPHTLNIQAQHNFGVLADNELAGLADQADKDFARAEWRIIPKTNATTLATYPQSQAMDWPTPISDLTDADSFGDDAAALLTVARVPASVTLAIAPFDLKVGKHIWIRSAVNEVNGPATVALIDENENQNEVKLTLFGLKD